MTDFFAWLGSTIGDIIRFLVDLLTNLFANLGDSVGGFLSGLSESLGIAPSLVSLGVLIIGLWLLWKGLRAITRGGLIAALIWWLLAVLVLSWLIN